MAWDRFRRAADDSGQALVLVLIVAVLLIGSVTIALASATSNLDLADNYQNSSQSLLSAQSGLAAEIAAMRQVLSYPQLPCSLTGTLSAPGVNSSYSVTTQYFTTDGAASTALTCSGSASTLGGTQPPTKAILTSTVDTPHGSPVVMREDVQIAADNPVLSEALQYAIFTPNNLTLSNDAHLLSNPANPNSAPPNMYIGKALTCNNGVLSAGSVTVYHPVTLANDCIIDGSLEAEGDVSLTNSASVGSGSNGSVTAYGGSITMFGNTVITGAATATGGGISLTNSPTIGGSASATGAITLSGDPTIVGAQDPGDSSLSSMQMPPEVQFPTVNNTVTDWLDAGWNVVQVPNSVYSCSTYFMSYSSGADDPFMLAAAQATMKTVFYAPTCAVTYHNAHTFELNDDVVLDVASLTLKNSNTFEATTTPEVGPPVSLSILAGVPECSYSPSSSSPCTGSDNAPCSTSTTDVTLSNLTTFDSSVITLIYTPGQVSYANAPSMLGQILACGGFIGTNAFTLDFATPSTDALPPFTTGGSVPPTLTPLAKYLVSS